MVSKASQLVKAFKEIRELPHVSTQSGDKFDTAIQEVLRETAKMKELDLPEKNREEEICRVGGQWRVGLSFSALRNATTSRSTPILRRKRSTSCRSEEKQNRNSYVE